MIDTDKYEGHTGPWKLNKPVENGDYTMQDEIGTYRGTFYSRFRVEDPRLKADAPLLLAEVKRLRGLLDAIHWDAFAEDDTTLEIDREVAERIRRGD